MNDFEKAKQFFIEGLRLLEANNVQAAETQFAKSLELIPNRVSTLNNLAAIKIRLNKFAEAEELALKTIAVEEKSPEAWSNLGIALTAMKRHEEALQAHDRALESNPAYARAWLNKAMTLLELKRYDEALPACDRALKLDSSQHEILYAKSRILKELGQPDEAQKTYLVSLEMRTAASPLFIAERRATQKAEALIISHNPPLDGSLLSYEALHRSCLNYPGQLATLLQEDFHFNFVFEGNAMRSAARGRIPQPDFVINNCANGALVLSQGNLPDLTALVDSFGVPVVNHPAKVIHTTRDTSAKLVEDVPDVRVPKTRRFLPAGRPTEALVQEIESQFDYPLITRTLTSHEGKGMNKADSRAALVEILSSGLPEEFFVTEFVNSKGTNPFFRKIRASIVKDEIIIVRVDRDTLWKVYGRKSDERVAFYLNNAHLLDEEKRICADPEGRLGKAVMQALRAIRSRIPLDVFGVDFDVDAEGTLIFYEANATMNLLSTAREEVPYPKDADDRLKQAFERYFTSLKNMKEHRV